MWLVVPQPNQCGDYLAATDVPRTELEGGDGPVFWGGVVFFLT